MRYWGKKIEIDGSFYNTDAGKRLSPTAAEMAQLKATNNIFQVEGNVEIFESVVQGMVKEIADNPVGKILIDALDRGSKTVRIIPLTWKEQTQLKRIPCNNSVGKPSTKGNDAVIWYEPWSRWYYLSTGGNSPFQVLVHELHHAFRTTRGKYWLQSGPPVRVTSAGTLLGGFPNMEELFSVTIENMYRSAEGQPGRMLGAYMQGVPLAGRTDASWYKQYADLLDLWCDDHRDVAMQLEMAHGFWNPFRVRRRVLDGLMAL